MSLHQFHLCAVDGCQSVATWDSYVSYRYEPQTHALSGGGCTFLCDVHHRLLFGPILGRVWLKHSRDKYDDPRYITGWNWRSSGLHVDYYIGGDHEAALPFMHLSEENCCCEEGRPYGVGSV